MPLPEPTQEQREQWALCDHYVVLPWGYERREPDCPECRAKMETTR